MAAGRHCRAAGGVGEATGEVNGFQSPAPTSTSASCTRGTACRALQYLEFTGTNSLDLRTRENNVVHVDVCLAYRLIPGEAHLVVREGFADSYEVKVRSVTEGFLREHLAQLSNQTVQIPEEREKVAKSAIALLSKMLRQYHVAVAPSGVVIRAISFDPPYEAQLQAKQLYAVQAELDTAKQNESKAKQETDTVEKGIDKDVATSTTSCGPWPTSSKCAGPWASNWAGPGANRPARSGCATRSGAPNRRSPQRTPASKTCARPCSNRRRSIPKWPLTKRAPGFASGRNSSAT